MILFLVRILSQPIVKRVLMFGGSAIVLLFFSRSDP
jgi:hypothetical protein